MAKVTIFKRGDKPIVGMTLYSLNVGNAARNCLPKLEELKVIKVGRKYFTCCVPGEEDKKYYHVQYHLDTWQEKTNYAATSYLYTSPQEWEEDKEREKLSVKFHNIFSRWSNHKVIPVDKLRAIDDILGDDYNG